MAITDKDKEREIALKFSKEYDYEFIKDKFTVAPCNIWGYIKHLEQRIIKLEGKS